MVKKVQHASIIYCSTLQHTNMNFFFLKSKGQTLLSEPTFIVKHLTYVMKLQPLFTIGIPLHYCTGKYLTTITITTTIMITGNLLHFTYLGIP